MCSSNAARKAVYPSNMQILQEFLVHITRGPIILTGIAFALHPLYVHLTSWMGSMGMSEAVVFAALINILHFILYTVCGGIAQILDTTKTWQQYKLYRTDMMTNPRSRYVQMWAEAIIGMIMGPFVMYFAYDFFDLGNTIFTTKNDEPLGDVFSVYVSLAVAKLFNTTGFYFAHRLFHHESLYATFHKQHHAFVGSIAWGAEFANPVEQIFANYLPSLMGIMFCCPHPMLFHLWVSVRLHQTYESHSGYAFHDTLLYKLGLTYSDETAFHDFHHTVNKGNYSARWIDGLFGTLDAWAEGGGLDGYLEKTAQAKVQQQKVE